MINAKVKTLINKSLIYLKIRNFDFYEKQLCKRIVSSSNVTSCTIGYENSHVHLKLMLRIELTKARVSPPIELTRHLAIDEQSISELLSAIKSLN